MATLLGSFLVRRWLLAEGDERVEIEHVQSGLRAVAPTIVEALDWMQAHAPDPAQRARSPADRRTDHAP